MLTLTTRAEHMNWHDLEQYNLALVLSMDGTEGRLVFTQELSIAAEWARRSFMRDFQVFWFDHHESAEAVAVITVVVLLLRQGLSRAEVIKALQPHKELHVFLCDAVTLAAHPFLPREERGANEKA